MNKSLVGVVAVLAVIVLSGCDLFKGQQPSGPAVQEVSVVLKEWQIIPARLTVKTGKVRFVVKNEGTVDHGFEVEGPRPRRGDRPVPSGADSHPRARSGSRDV
jgi:hypothetical protein